MLRHLILGLGLLAVGCGGGPKPDVETARTALKVALDSWQKAEAPAKLKTAVPAIEFADDERRLGLRLQSYQLGAPTIAGDQVRCTATLSLLDKKGNKREREAVYMVALKSPVVIARDPMD